MSWDQFQQWAFTGSLGIVATIGIWGVKSIVARLDKLDDKLDTEVATIRERLARIEGQLHLPATK